MKTFKDYLTEAQKTYAVRIKVAGELPEGFEKSLKDYMTKYETTSFKKVASTPIQEHPHEFPRLKNQEVSIFDIEANYPMSHQMLEQLISDTFGIPQDHVRVKHPADPTETEEQPEGEYKSKLEDSEYKDDTSVSEPMYCDEYNMSLFKELMKSRKDSEREDVQGEGKVVEMGKEDTSSPVASNKKSK